jgi:predicted dehydrogenase
MLAKPIVQTWKDTACLVGLFDLNRTRAQRLSEECGGIPVFSAFEAMLEEARPGMGRVRAVAGARRRPRKTRSIRR